MIIEWFFSLLLELLSWLIGLLPTWELAEDGSNWIWDIAGLNQFVGGWFPVQTLFDVFLLWISLEVLYAGVSLATFVYDRVRGA